MHKHNNRPHYIIQISPAIERFILEAVQIQKIDLTNYGLPSSFEDFKKVSKSTNSKDDQRFKRLFRDLKYMGGTELDVLAGWVS